MDNTHIKLTPEQAEKLKADLTFKKYHGKVVSGKDGISEYQLMIVPFNEKEINVLFAKVPIPQDFDHIFIGKDGYCTIVAIRINLKTGYSHWPIKRYISEFNIPVDIDSVINS